MKNEPAQPDALGTELPLVIADSMRALWAQAVEHGGRLFEQQRKVLESALATAQQELTASQIELAGTRGRLEAVESAIESTVRAVEKRSVDAQLRLAELTLWCESFRLEGKFSSESFAQAAAEAQKGSEICILNTFIPNLSDIAHSLTDALDRGVAVRILILRRKCREVKYRAETLGRDLDHVEQQIEQTLDNIRDQVYAKTRNENRHLLTVRVFECWPPFALYATERQIRVGYYLHGELAVHGPQLVVSSRHESFATFQAQFKNIWKLEHTKDLSMPDWRTADGLLDRKRLRN